MTRKSINQLVYMSTHWPQFQSSAASVRTVNLLNSLVESFQPKQIIMCSPQKLSNRQLIDNLHSTFNNLEMFTQPINQPLDTSKIQSPDIAIFDTFVSEEYYGKEMYHKFPNCVTVCDTQDIRSLRFLRESMVMNKPITNIAFHDFDEVRRTMESDQVDKVFSQPFKDAFPSPDHELFIRELSSIWRSDLSLIVSHREMELLESKCKLPAEKLLLAPFIFTRECESADQKRTFEKRKHFIHIGSFRHPPNRDAVLFLKYYIWPRIRARVGDAELHVYGSYTSQEFLDLEDKANGFRMKKLLPSVAMMEKYRVNLAPLRFGAGIKGKIADGWAQYTPCITTWIGAEGMYREPEYSFAGIVAENNWDEFVDASVDLYTNCTLWNEHSQKAKRMSSSTDSLLSDHTSQQHLERVLSHLLDKSPRDRLSYMTSIIRGAQDQFDFKSKYLQMKRELQLLTDKRPALELESLH